MCVSWAALPILVHFVTRKLISTAFHANIKTYASLIPFIVTDPCELLIPRTLFIIIHVPLLYGVFGSSFIMIGMMIERIVALVYHRDYESWRTLLGPFLAAAATSCGILITVYPYHNEQFTAKQVSFIATPGSAAEKKICAFWAGPTDFARGPLRPGLAQKMAGVVGLTCWPSHKLANGENGKPLSSRYQMSENVRTTKFTVVISLIHVIVYLIYLSGTLTTRLHKDSFATPVDFQAFRGVFFFVPDMFLFMGCMAQRLLDSMRMAETKRIRTSVAIRFNGVEGANNYFQAIQKQWNSIDS
ncbi:unnamed protein product [Caenorhabditis auriculariae]|uniref:Uncharacterized protein n=1 Tax=Caenorhabditis auriculariae TaxID=2777116 RepID=A0A8S1HDK9_9PELO|nr:unnamed protein product [Caenorhabditis auriculariae]